MSKWFDPGWYQYLLGSSDWHNLLCRMRGHPSGVVWYNLGGNEPDMHCKNCWELLG